jgi:cardiolipin synthase A/B
LRRFRALVVVLLAISLGIAAAAIVHSSLDDHDPRLSFVDESHSDNPGLTGVIVLPDDGREAILSEIDAAQSSIRLAIYLLSDDETIDALVRAHNRGVDVRVLLEERPFGGAGNTPEIFDLLEAAGIDIRWSNPVFRFSHVKTFIIDSRVAIIMNLNLTRTAFTSNRELAIITTQAAPVAQAAAIFESDWNRSAEPPDGPLVVSPTTSRTDLLALIESATEQLDLYAEFITDEEITTALIKAIDRGVDVRLIMSRTSGQDPWEGRPGELAANGADVRLLGRLYMHAKMVMADRQAVYIGSQNFTSTSLDQNREIGMIVMDEAVIERVARTFESDLAAATKIEELQ